MQNLTRRLAVFATCVVVLGGVRLGHAGSLSPTNPTFPLGNVTVGSSVPLSETFTSTGANHIDSVVKDATCSAADIALVSTTPAIPVGGLDLANGDTLAVNVTFAPATRGLQTCKIDLKTAAAVVDSVTVTGTGVATISTLSVMSPLAFGAVRVTSGTNPVTFTITNTGDAGTPPGPLTVASATIGGANPADFVLTTDPTGASLTKTQSTNVKITFNPSATGARAATLTLVTNDPINSPQVVALTGTGTTAIVSLPTSFNFTTVLAGAVTPHTIAIGNTGTAALSVTGATLAGGSWLQFANVPAGSTSCANLANATCSFAATLSVAAAGTGNLGIQCAPPVDTTGTQTATLTLTSDTDPSSATSTTLSCTAAKPDISIAPATLAHAFGNVHLGNNGVFNSLVISNTGGEPLTYTIARSTGGTAADFAISGLGCSGTSCTTTLAATATATYTVTFTPSGQGARGATLAITSDDQDVADAAQTFTLTGTGTQATVTTAAPTPATGGTLAFGNQEVSVASSALAVTLQDSGNEDMTVTSATLTGAAFTLASGLTGSQAVPHGTSVTWTITCKPASRGLKSGTFVVANSSTNTPSYSITLTCTGIAGNLVASVVSEDFSNQREGTVVSKTYMVTNTGEQTVTLAAAAVVNPANVGYSVTSTLPATLAAAASTNVTVKFAPVAGMDGGAATVTVSGTDGTVATAAAINLTGTGQAFGVAITCPDCSANPTAWDAGNVRWDNTRAEVFTITNTAASAVTIMAVALTAVGNFTLAGAPASPIVLAQGGTLLVTVTADPNDTMLGTFTSKLEITTDLPSPMQTIDVGLTVTSVSPVLAIDPGMTVDLGGVDIDKGPAAQVTITLTNTGNGQLDINGGAALTGVFTSLAVPVSHLAPTGATTVHVTYLPTVEKTAAAGDTQALVITMDGLFSTMNPGPSAITINLKGHGTDRHVQLVNSPVQFPPTFRNVADADAPVLACTIGNTGEAPLSITAVMLTGDPTFTLLDDQPVMVAGGAQAMFHVRFQPTAAIGTYAGHLGLMHDDNGAPTPDMSDCELDGTAAARAVMLSPSSGPLDLGITAVGVPVLLSARQMPGLQLLNLDATHTFAVRQVSLTGDTNEFSLVDTAMTTSLAPNATAPYDVQFTPDHAGVFTVTVQVFLDADPDVQTSLDITGTAVDVRVHGGGGCTASGGGADTGALVIVVVVFGGLGVAARRRRRVVELR